MNLEEKQEVLNEHFNEIINEDPYEISQDIYQKINIINERRVSSGDGDTTIYLTVDFDTDLFMAEYQYSSWVGTFGESKGFLPAEKYTYTEGRYRHV